MAEKKFIQKATERMKEKGTVGKFGKATEKKIAAGKKAGGVKKKEAVFAENMKKIAGKHRRSKGMHMGEHDGHKAITSQTGRTMGMKKGK